MVPYPLTQQPSQMVSLESPCPQPLPPMFSLGLVTVHVVTGASLSTIASTFSGLSTPWTTCVYDGVLYMVAPNGNETASLFPSSTPGAVDGYMAASCAEACGRPLSCPCNPCAPELECPIEYGAQFVATLQTLASEPVDSTPPYADLNLYCAPIEGDGCAILPTTVYSAPITLQTPSNTAMGFPIENGQPRVDGAIVLRDNFHVTIVLPNTAPWLPCSPLTTSTSPAAHAFAVLAGQ